MEARRAADADPRTAPWWLWPHLLSLDAPLVAVAWQRCWAQAAHLRPPLDHSWVLGLGVWLIYLADRLADSMRTVPGDPATPRHAFHARWRVGLSCLAGVVALTLMTLAPRLLSHVEFFRGLLLLTLAGTYFGLIHSGVPRGWTARLPKEAAVGGMFAAGTAFFPWCLGGMGRPGLPAGVLVFAGLCFCNCGLITVWEQHAQDLRCSASLLNAFPWLAARLRGLCLVLAGLAGAGLLLAGPLPFLPLAFGGLLLALLDYGRARISPDMLRVLADAALLTPFLFAGHAFV